MRASFVTRRVRLLYLTNPIGFDAPDNEVTVLSRDGKLTRVERVSKDEVARRILDEIERLRESEEHVDSFESIEAGGGATNGAA